MEIGGNMNINMLGHDQNCTISSRGQNGNNNHLWDIWGGAAVTTNNIFYSADAVTVTTSGEASSSEANSGHALIMGHPLQLYSDFYSGSGGGGGGAGGGGGGGGGVTYGLDPHLMCLKLGKRHYFEDHAAQSPLVDHRHVARFPVGMMSKKGKAAAVAGQLCGGDGPALTIKVVPRCQVDGCHVALINAKEYHRRHKVCEMHSKASKVTVSDQVQRFCQQCSRFHAVSEFDEAKRSCRRRLAGHNERRRKSSHDSLPRTSSQGRALSLLSSKTTNFHSWVSPSSDLSSRSSAALRELIAENRAAIVARQLIFSSDRHWDSTPHNNNSNNNNNNETEDLFAVHGAQPWSSFVQPHQHQMFSDHHNQYGAHLTLDLRQAPAQAAYGFLPERARAKAEEDQECDLWNSFQGTNLV